MGRSNTGEHIDVRLDLPSALMVRFLESQGQALLAQQTVEQYRQRGNGGVEEEVSEDELQGCIRPYKKSLAGL